jgi:hypothetical protein|tara:strand:- start:2069 stop:2872 length:804 start_codon:yes stop_codon:yes gene_type:complete
MAQQISWLTPREAQEARAELLEALGTENNPAQWMQFMETVTKRLPDVLSSGRPSAEAIKHSVIGQLGFSSWRAMIEAPTAEGGLAWNWSAWVAWRRAWKVVQTWPYLRDLPLTAAQVNRIHQASKDSPEGFPASAAALEAWESEQKEQRQEQRNVSVETLKNQVQELERKLQDTARALDMANTKAENLENQARAADAVLSERNQDLGKLQAQYEHLELDRDALEIEFKELEKKARQDAQALEKVRKIAKQHQNMTRWDHFKAWLGLD